MIDSLTKWAEAVVVDDAMDAETVASLFLRTWVCRFGVPAVVVTDQGKAFTSTLFSRLADALGVQLIHSTPYHPEGNAPVESFHRRLATLLRFQTNHALPFDEALQLALFAYRCTPHATTLDSPMFLVYGQDPFLGNDADWRFDSSATLRERLRLLSHTRLDVQLHAQLHRQRALATANAKRQPLVFAEGQLVLTRVHPESRVQYKPPAYKLIPVWSFPHRVLSHWADGRVAMVKCLLTGTLRQVHIQNTKFLDAPVDEQQAREWLELVSRSDIATSLDPSTRDIMFRQFFEAVLEPQRDITNLPRPKRQRQV